MRDTMGCGAGGTMTAERDVTRLVFDDDDEDGDGVAGVGMI